eukprot:Selendium_serpulae@DN7692_c0_g1_i1.p1
MMLSYRPSRLVGSTDKESTEQKLNAPVEEFERSATNSEGTSADWDHTFEVAQLKGIVKQALASNKRSLQEKLERVDHKDSRTYFLNRQQHQIKKLQQTLQHATFENGSPLRLGLAYRVPGTNIYLKGSYQQTGQLTDLMCT